MSHNNRRGGISPLEDAELRGSLAEAYVAGASVTELAETFGCTRATVRKWLKDPRIQGAITQGMTERVNRLTRKIDTELENRIAGPHLKHMPLDELLKIRREVMGPQTQKVQVDQRTTAVSIEATTMDLWGALDGDPEAMKALSRVIGDKPGELEQGIEDADVIEEGEEDGDAVPALGADLA